MMRNFFFHYTSHKKNKMMRIWFTCVLLLFIVNGFSQQKIILDNNAEVRQVAHFSEIEVEGGIDVYFSPDVKRQLVVSATPVVIRNLINTEVIGNRLKIYSSPDRRHVAWGRKMIVYVSAPYVEKIIANGASDVHIQGILKVEKLTMQLSGASDFFGSVKVEDLSIQQSGSSDVTITGEVKSMKVVLSGASDLNGFQCQADYLNANVSGASNLQITVNEELDVSASGASDVRFKGKGILKKQSSSGASSIKAVDSERL